MVLSSFWLKPTRQCWFDDLPEHEVNPINLFRGEEDPKLYHSGEAVFKAGDRGEHMYLNHA